MVRVVTLWVAASLIGLPLGIWVLRHAPGGILRRIIGAVLIVVVAMSLAGRRPIAFQNRWSSGVSGAMAGVLAGAVAMPGPPVVLYATAQDWEPRTVKATLLTFFSLNQAAALVGYQWSGLLGPRMWALSLCFSVPAGLGILAGAALFGRIDQTAFRRGVFLLLPATGVSLLVRG